MTFPEIFPSQHKKACNDNSSPTLGWSCCGDLCKIQSHVEISPRPRNSILQDFVIRGHIGHLTPRLFWSSIRSLHNEDFDTWGASLMHIDDPFWLWLLLLCFPARNCFKLSHASATDLGPNLAVERSSRSLTIQIKKGPKRTGRN